jgi:hypothetical protein
MAKIINNSEWETTFTVMGGTPTEGSIPQGGSTTVQPVDRTFTIYFGHPAGPSTPFENGIEKGDVVSFDGLSIQVTKGISQ